MSNSIHNAPIQLTNQKSNRSLYTENSQNSDEQQIQKYQAKQTNERQKQSPRRQQLISQKINKLPTIGLQSNSWGKAEVVQQDTQKGNVKNKNEGFDGMPRIPERGGPARYKQPQGLKKGSLQLGGFGGPQFNTIAVTSLDRNQLGNMYGQSFNPMNMTGMSGMSGTGSNHDNQRTRMLRSSQGGRWFRSQSLMQQKPKQKSSSTSSIQQSLSKFHAHESKYTQKLQQYRKFYSQISSQLSNKQQQFQKYKIKITDNVQQIKNKMQNYLQSKIDLSNLSIDRPDTDWGQQMLSKFYLNYQQVLLQRFQLASRKEKGKGEEKEKEEEKVTVVLKKYKNCAYYGPVKDGKKHGFGYLHYFSGRFYEGLFQNDQKIKGFQMDDSQLYLGGYDKNQRHGQGILKTNQYLLCGRFTNGQFKYSEPSFSQSSVPIRKGFKIQFSSVVFYMGNSSNIVFQKSSTNDIYIGEYNEESLKNGQGLEIFSNGDIYIGRYQQGAPEGYGQYYWESGAFYRGQFLSGMRHGKGKWMMVHGDKYEGDYLNDKKNGKGVYLWKSGDRYSGQFENDYRHGYGQMYWRDGTSYKGQWLNGIQVTKNFQLTNTIAQKQQPQKTKNSFKTQTRTRILKKQQISKNSKTLNVNQHQNPNTSISRNPKNIKSLHTNSHTIEQTYSQPARNPYLEGTSGNKRIPLEKLKAMLNPSNSTN